MEKQKDIMIKRSDLIKLGFKPNQATQIIKECKEYLINVEGINFYSNRQVGVVPARVIEKLFHIQVL